jgi:hypothetical protein
MPRFICTPLTTILAPRNMLTTRARPDLSISIGTTRDLRAVATASAAAAFYIAPALGFTPANLPARVHYDALTASLSGRALRPDPDPPRPSPLS